MKFVGIASERPMTHPLEVALVNILIVVVLSWYLSRSRTTVNQTGVGTVFVTALPWRIFFGLVFFGFPALWIYLAPTMTRPVEAIWFSYLLLGGGSIGYLILASTRIEILEEGFVMSYVFYRRAYRFDEFKDITVERHMILLKHKSGRWNGNVAIPMSMACLWELNDYLRRKITSATSTSVLGKLPAPFEVAKSRTAPNKPDSGRVI